MRQGAISGVLGALATIASVCLMTACSGGAPAGAAGPGPGDRVAPPSLDGADLPPAPPDPLPDTLNLPGGQGGGGAAAPAPSPTPPPMPAKADHTFFAVDGELHLVRFTEGDPGKTTKTTIAGLAAGERVVGLGFRPKDGKLYGLSSASRLLALDPVTAKATAVGPTFVVPLVGRAFGFGFDPIADEARVHSDLAEDLRVDPKTGWLSGDDPGLVFRSDDVYAGESPSVVGTAHTKSGATSALYAIDAAHDVLGALPSPLSGEVVTIGALGLDVEGPAGFDIAPSGEAYGAFRVGTETSLYAVDLESGKAKALAPIGVTSAIAGLAVQP